MLFTQGKMRKDIENLSRNIKCKSDFSCFGPILTAGCKFLFGNFIETAGQICNFPRKEMEILSESKRE